MLGDIDFTLKPQQAKLFLAKPDKTTIGKLSDAYDIALNIRLGGINELTFKIPYDIDVNHYFQRNTSVGNVKERYFLRIEVGAFKEWYVVTNINDTMDADVDYREVKAFSIAYMLKDKIIRDLVLESKNARQAFDEALKNTVWSIDYLDADFELKYRQLNVSSKSVLDFVIEIASTFQGVLFFNTLNYTISLRKPDLVGTNKGLTFSYGHYLNTLGRESNSDEMVTRLKVFGNDGLSIHRVNPIGQNYLEDFSYFMYPFATDVAGNVTAHSFYMSDDLCKALVAYDALVESKQGEFNDLLTQRAELDDNLRALDTEMSDLKGQEASILDIKDVQQADATFSIFEFLYMGSSLTKSMVLKPNMKFAVMAKVDTTTDLTLSVNGLTSNLKLGEWTILQKLQLSNVANVTVGGTAANQNIKIQICAITDEEFAGKKIVLADDGINTVEIPITETEILDRYCLLYKQGQITAKQTQIDAKKDEIATVDADVAALKLALSAEQNFSSALLRELNGFVIEKEFSDDNIIVDTDLYEAAKKNFDELRTPQMVITVDTVNFLECIEEQGNWHKLMLGDIITIKYEKFNTKVQAKIIEVAYDFENGTIKLTIANIKDISTDTDKLMKYLYNAVSTSTLVDMSKYKWDSTGDLGEIDRIINHLWDRTKDELDMAANETVVIDRRGITIYDPNDRNKFLRATHGVLGITDDGGNTYKTAITYYGLVAERVFGKIITGERVIVGDPDGILEIRGNKGVVTDRAGREVMWFGLYDNTDGIEKFGLKLENDTNQVIVDRDSGFKITRKNGSDWVDMAWLDTDGILHARGIKIEESEIDQLFGVLTNGITIDPTNGIQVTRSDGLVRTRMNATEGIAIERWNGSAWFKKFYADTNGYLWVEDLTAKRIKVVNDFNEELINSDTSYMNIARFDTIIVDGVLSPLEKVQLKGEWARIQSEYQMLLAQAQNYRTTTRDGSIRIDTSPLTLAYTNLNNYIVPLLQDMNTVTAIDRDIFIAKFKDYFDAATDIINKITDSLKYSSLQLGQLYNNVLIDAADGVTATRSDNMFRARLNATDGISIEVNVGGTWEKRFWADLSGTLHLDTVEARRLILRGNNGEILLDADQKVLRLDNFDMIIGSITAEQINAAVITAIDGFIANLTVNHLKTLTQTAEGVDTAYIDIQGNMARWVSGHVVPGSGVQVKNKRNELLYWTDAAKTSLTTNTTSYPAMQYNYDEVDRLRIAFDDATPLDPPYMRFGIGDGSESNVGKGWIRKTDGNFVFNYYTGAVGNERKLQLRDTGITIETVNTGDIQIKRGSSIIEIKDDGSLKLTHSSGSYISIANDIRINAVGNVYLN